ncbi:ScbA/BarX family gamma-butyrolactone biosynthesis protein [Streptomyces fragilis]|uniref:ScbA/BarX family gamma-butyrolactone biosynthesis protein n=1 Tax=Streptomyces fragilis TaxID=67301 RepID=A0ABV2YJG3_9ACTN|nr:ScbA/BarX family gamma-butyrolactone biosynthesis protein [Streptomyces fragilis]
MTHSITGTTTAPVTSALAPLVRKTRPHETLVTAWTMLTETTQQVTVRWPHDHGFYTEDGRYSPLLLTEGLRQSLALLTHQVHGIPLGHRLGWERMRLTIDPAALTPRSTPAADTLTLLVTHSRTTRRRMGSVHLTSHIQALRLGTPIADADVHYTTHPPALYDRLRGPYADANRATLRALPPTAPIAPHQVGRHNPHNVVLSPTPSPTTWQLRVDPSHRILFDHPHDHVPGMLLLEAAAQAAKATLPHPVDTTGIDTRFIRYVELDRPCLLTAEPSPPDTTGHQNIHIHATQNNNPVFTTTITTTPHPH